MRFLCFGFARCALSMMGRAGGGVPIRSRATALTDLVLLYALRRRGIAKISRQCFGQTVVRSPGFNSGIDLACGAHVVGDLRPRWQEMPKLFGSGLRFGTQPAGQFLRLLIPGGSGCGLKRYVQSAAALAESESLHQILSDTLFGSVPGLSQL